MKHGAPFSGLIVGSFELMKRKASAVTVGVISFAMLAAVSSAFVQRKIDAIETTLATHFSLSREELETTVQQQVNTLSSLDMKEFIAAIEDRGGSPSIDTAPTLPSDRIGITYVARIGPFIAFMVLLDCVIAFVAFVYFLILFSRGSISAYEASVVLPKYVASTAFLLLWLFIRSLLWIPLLGPVIAVYFLPRMSLAPVIHASGETGVLESISASLQRTSHQWSTVFLRNIGILLVLGVLLWPAMVTVAAVSLFSIKIGYILWLCALIAEIAFFCATQVMLAAMLA